MLSSMLDPPLEWAAAEPLPFFRRLYENELPVAIAKAEFDGALYRAVRAGNMPVVRYLIGKGVSVNSHPIDIDTPDRQEPRPVSPSLRVRGAPGASQVRVACALHSSGARP